MMYFTTINGRDSTGAWIDTDGRKLILVGNLDLFPGMNVCTDGKFIFGRQRYGEMPAVWDNGKAGIPLWLADGTFAYFDTKKQEIIETKHKKEPASICAGFVSNENAFAFTDHEQDTRVYLSRLPYDADIDADGNLYIIDTDQITLNNEQTTDIANDLHTKIHSEYYDAAITRRVKAYYYDTSTDVMTTTLARDLRINTQGSYSIIAVHAYYGERAGQIQSYDVLYNSNLSLLIREYMDVSEITWKQVLESGNIEQEIQDGYMQQYEFSNTFSLFANPYYYTKHAITNPDGAIIFSEDNNEHSPFTAIYQYADGKYLLQDQFGYLYVLQNGALSERLNEKLSLNLKLRYCKNVTKLLAKAAKE